MGVFSSKLSSESKDVYILMIGLDSAGKTSILYRLKTGKEVPECSTIGFNVESFSYKGLNFTFLDVGG